MYKCGIHSIVHVTAPTIELAKSLARGLITKDLAACVNLIPNVTSIYKWKGEVIEDSEILMIESGNNSYMKYISECVPEASEN